MNAIVLLSHGSVLCGSEQNLLNLANQMRSTAGDLVEAGFLNYSEPSFETAVELCVKRGASEITVVPYFLVAGKFATEDLPGRMQSMAERYRGICLKLAEPLRFHPLLADAVLSAAERSREPAAWRSEIAEAARFCRRSARCPIFGQPPCPAEPVAGETP